MTDSNADEALVRSAFRDLHGAVPSPAPTRLATMEATVNRRRRRRVTGMVAVSALVTALVVTPTVLARGEGPADPPPAAPPTQPIIQRPLGSCPSDAARRGADLSVTATDLAMGPVRGEQQQTRRRGDMVVTVCNAGRAVAPAGTLTLRWLATIPPDVPMGNGSWEGCRYGEPERESGPGGEVTYNVVNCGYPELPPGSSWEPMFLFEMPGDADPRFGRPLAQYARVPDTGDVNAGNNRATFKNKAADPVGSVSQPARPSCSSKTSPQGADLSVVATALTLGPTPAGNEPRRGDMIITVCNIGRAAAPAGTLTLRWLTTIPPDVEMGSGSWEGCRYGEPERESARGGEVTYNVVDCAYAGLAPGESREHMFLFEIPGGADPGIDRPVAQYAQVSKTGDTNTGNNRATFKVATV
jgi:hypothetical protein